jgi:hypothetical protein
MKLQKIRKHLLATAVGAVMAMGAATQAMASPTTPITIDPSALGGPAATFLADYLQINASELLKNNGTSTGHTASGVISVGGFVNGITNVGAGITGLGTAYNLYMTFDLVDTLASGTFNGQNSSYTMNVLNVKIWADMDANTLTNTVNGSAAATGTDASLGGTTSDDVLLAVADLVSGTGFLVGVGGGNGISAKLDATLNFAICNGGGVANIGGSPGGTPATGNLAGLADGTTAMGIAPAGASQSCSSNVGNSFFAAPRPFYELAFTSFTNTGQNAIVNGDGTVGVINAGQLDFGRVPEPGTLALLSLGLFGVGAMVRSRKA